MFFVAIFAVILAVALTRRKRKNISEEEGKTEEANIQQVNNCKKSSSVKTEVCIEKIIETFLTHVRSLDRIAAKGDVHGWGSIRCERSVVKPNGRIRCALVLSEASMFLKGKNRCLTVKFDLVGRIVDDQMDNVNIQNVRFKENALSGGGKKKATRKVINRVLRRESVTTDIESVNATHKNQSDQILKLLTNAA